MVDFIPFIISLMIFWDFTIHIIDKRDRNHPFDAKWRVRLIRSKSKFSYYYYPHFWGKKSVNDEHAWKRYDIFWSVYWGIALALMAVYIIFK